MYLISNADVLVTSLRYVVMQSTWREPTFQSAHRNLQNSLLDERLDIEVCLLSHIVL